MHGGAATSGGQGQYTRRMKGEMEELEDLPPEPVERNWAGMTLAAVVILQVLGMVSLAIYLLRPSKTAGPSTGDNIQLNHILSGKFRPNKYHHSWISDSEYLYKDQDGEVVLSNVITNVTKVLMDNTTFRQLNSETYSISGDLFFILVQHDSLNHINNKDQNVFSIFNVSSKCHNRLEIGGKWSFNSASWVGRENALVVILNNNIFYKKSVVHQPLQVTSSGQIGGVLNGIADFLYTEIFADKKVHWSSPGGEYLSFLSINNSGTETHKFTMYAGSQQDREIKYPRPGGMLPAITLSIVDLSQLANKKTNSGKNSSSNIADFHQETQGWILKTLQPPEELLGPSYVSSVQWWTNSSIAICWENRSQNISIVTICMEPAFNCNTVYSRHGTLGPVRIKDHFKMSASLNVLLYLDNQVSNGRIVSSVRWKRLNSHESGLVFTDSNIHVHSLLEWDTHTNIVYLMGGRANEEHHLFHVPVCKKLVGGSCTHDHPIRSFCLTCSLTS